MSDYGSRSPMTTRKMKPKRKAEFDNCQPVQKFAREDDESSDKSWCLFCFLREKSLACVPASWVNSTSDISSDDILQQSKCWWPYNSPKEAIALTFSMLIKNCCEPDYQTWHQHEGVELGTFDSYDGCQSALQRYEPIVTSTEDADEVVKKVTAAINGQARQKMSSAFLENVPEPDYTEPSSGTEETLKFLCIKMQEEQTKMAHFMNNVSRSLYIMDQKLNAVHSYLRSSAHASAGYGWANANLNSLDQNEEDSSDSQIIINQMASSIPEVRGKANYMQCLEELGFPATKSPEELKVADKKMSGVEDDSKKRRNALINALTAAMPHIGTGKSTVHSAIRTCMYAIAPPRLWQFFSSQGKSGTKRHSLALEMPNIYKAILTAAANRSKLDKNTIVAAVSDILRSCQSRSESKRYRMEYPELFSTTPAPPLEQIPPWTPRTVSFAHMNFPSSDQTQTDTSTPRIASTSGNASAYWNKEPSDSVSSNSRDQHEVDSDYDPKNDS